MSAFSVVSIPVRNQDAIAKVQGVSLAASFAFQADGMLISDPACDYDNAYCII